jgi:hypothetical protein
VRALLIPAETRFATELICVRSTLEDKGFIQKLFVEAKVETWADAQPADVKIKYRKHRANALSFDWWHKSEVFAAGHRTPSKYGTPYHYLPNMAPSKYGTHSNLYMAVEEVVETSLRVLDSDTPNLKDTAFGYYSIKTEFGDPLLGKLAQIKDWGQIDLCLNLRSENMGTLASYVNSCLKKREADWLCPLVVAAAGVNPIYTYSPDEQVR